MALSVCLPILCLIAAVQAQNYYAFDAPDLETVHLIGAKEVKLEAFSAQQNAAILQKLDNLTSSQLTWVSLGDPELVERFSSNNQTRILHFAPNRVIVYISLLTHSMRERLVQAAQLKYGVTVGHHQILSVSLSHADCTIPIQTDDGKRLKLRGSATNLNANPLQMLFDAPNWSLERSLLEHQQRKAGSQRDARVLFRCQFAALGKLNNIRFLSVTTTQIQQLGVKDKLFGSGSAPSVYVSRQQLTAFAAEMYEKLSIANEYDMSQYEFIELFVQDLLQQTAVESFTQVSITNATEALSKYATSISGEFKTDDVLRDVNAILGVETVGGKSRIVINTQMVNEANLRHVSSHRRLTVSTVFFRERMHPHSRSFYETFALVNAVMFVSDMSQHWLDAGKSLDVQLQELNAHSQNEVEWAIEEEKVVPRRVNVALLSKGAFSKTLQFSAVKKDILEGSFLKRVDLYSEPAREPMKIPPRPEGFTRVEEDYIQQQVQQLSENIRLNDESLRIEMSRQAEAVGRQVTELTELKLEFQSEKRKLQQLTDDVNSKIQSLRDDLRRLT